MRIDRKNLHRIEGSRYGFMIADQVLRDMLEDFARGSGDPDELDVALSQHRLAYEGYVRRLRSCLRPVVEA